MSVKVGINGYGRIGRNVVRAALNNPEIEFVAVNDLTDITTLAHLTKYDSLLGPLPEKVSIEGDSILIGSRKIKVFAEKDPGLIDWSSARHRKEGHHLRARERRRHHHRTRREREVVRSGEAQRHLERILHHQLPRARGQGPA